MISCNHSFFCVHPSLPFSIKPHFHIKCPPSDNHHGCISFPFNSSMTSCAFSLQLSTTSDMVLNCSRGKVGGTIHIHTLSCQHVVCQTVFAEGDNGWSTHLASDIHSTITVVAWKVSTQNPSKLCLNGVAISASNKGFLF